MEIRLVTPEEAVQEYYNNNKIKDWEELLKYGYNPKISVRSWLKTLSQNKLQKVYNDMKSLK